MLGAGTVAQALARHAIRQGHEVVLSNSRGPASLTPLVRELGPLAGAATPAEAAAADLVVLAVGWPRVPEVAAALPRLDGTVVVDATNQFASLPRTRGSPTWATSRAASTWPPCCRARAW